jgi:hypothetical protein
LPAAQKLNPVKGTVSPTAEKLDLLLVAHSCVSGRGLSTYLQMGSIGSADLLVGCPVGLQTHRLCQAGSPGAGRSEHNH